MTTHRLNAGAAHRIRTEPQPSIVRPWILLGHMVGWIAVGFTTLFVILFLLALIGVLK